MIDFQIAQVHTIFELPPDFATYAEPLAYVTYFTPLQYPEPGIEMYSVSYATMRYQNHVFLMAAVIPVSRIMRTCHLIPHFGRSIPSSWSQENIYNQASKFYVNPYLRFRDFFLFRCILPIHLHTT